MATVTITIPSNRIYLDTLSTEEVDYLKQTMFCNNWAKEHLYNVKYDNHFTNQGIGKENETAAIKQWIKETLNISPSEYYITSLMSHTNGMISSQKELEKLYSKEHKTACEKRKKKLKTLRRRLTMCKKSKQSLIQYSKHSCNPKALYIPKDFKDKIDNINNKEQVYLYEIWLTKEIKILTARIHQIEEKDRNAKAKHENRKVPRATFGTKHFYKLKDTVKDIDMNEWHKERNFRRNNIILFSGRFDSRYKNWLCKYDVFSKRMNITLMNGKTLSLKDVVFPYRGKDLESVLLHKKEAGYSVGYWLELRKDHNGREFILIKATFRLYKEIEADTSNGVIAIDMNLDNISWAELDSEGHRLHGGMFHFNLDVSTRKNTDTIGRACSRVIDLCKKTQKPLIIENIDLIKKKASLAYGNKKANFATTNFAYSKMETFLISQAFRAGIAIKKVNPAYTSFIGKVKYMRNLRCKTHEAAAYVIGRRGMGYKENVPSYLKSMVSEKVKRGHHWKQFACLYKKLKKEKVDVFLRWNPTPTLS